MSCLPCFCHAAPDPAARCLPINTQGQASVSPPMCLGPRRWPHPPVLCAVELTRMAPVDASRLDAAGRLRWNRGYDLVEQIMLHPRQETAG
ncbi:hypothetical protein PVAP13_1KG096777 [Panicum virgatum]|uniref:Uncharacterized protein n=1 Tax=Panicum virgatum TaxID=38727 RepID=A0A8T0XGV2_PANVG|nr:hypothetical protein PVAP13_1KG096777 [Panicum virgatum]